MKVNEIADGNYQDYLKDLRTNRSAAEEMAGKPQDTELTGMLNDIERMAQSEEKTQLYLISVKLSGGKELSGADLELLRRCDPATYRKALRVAKAREELRQKLRNAKSEHEIQALRAGVTQTAVIGGEVSPNGPASSAVQVRGEPALYHALADEWSRSRPKLDRFQKSKK